MREPAYSFLSPNSTTMLFLEKIVKCAACAGGADGRTSRIVSFTFYRGSGHKMGAFVANILLSNTLKDGLRTLKLGTGIKMTAVLATAQVGTAFGTLAAFDNFNGFRYYCAAHCAAQQLLEPRHLHSPGNVAR